MNKYKKFIDGSEGIVPYSWGDPYTNPVNISRNPSAYIQSISKPSYITENVPDTPSVNILDVNDNFLFVAIKSGDINMTKLLLEVRKFDLNKTYDSHSNGVTPIIYAIKIQSKDMVELLLNCGADINKPDINGKTPLMYAITHGDKDMVKLLIEAGADVNVKDNYGLTPLMLAVKGCNPDILDLLIRAGADINKEDDNGKTPIMYSIIHGNKDMVKLLLRKGATVRIVDVIESVKNFEIFKLCFSSYTGDEFDYKLLITGILFGLAIRKAGKSVYQSYINYLRKNIRYKNILNRIAMDRSKDIDKCGICYKYFNLWSPDFADMFFLT
jgi:ankyrin repeat protein